MIDRQRINHFNLHLVIQREERAEEEYRKFSDEVTFFIENRDDLLKKHIEEHVANARKEWNELNN